MEDRLAEVATVVQRVSGAGCAPPPADPTADVATTADGAYAPAMARFLVKTEPSTYSFADLRRDKRTVWDGVSNPVALKHLATIRKGDTVIVYHTGDEKQAVGLAIAASDAYPDPKLKDPKRPVVDLAADKALPKPVSLAQVKADAALKGTELARLPRLSVMPFSEAEFQRLLRLAGA
jgi:predicted RNA-binding protein with PUA-like domain